MSSHNTIYLDHNATSPPSSEHLEKAMAVFQQSCGNPSSPHSLGRASSVALTKARHAVANALGVGVGEIVFVSGGTEANHMGTVGVLQHKGLFSKNEKACVPHVIYSAVEHPAVGAGFEHLASQGLIKATVVPVDSQGKIRAQDVFDAINQDTVLIAIMAANNEVGTIQPVLELGQELHRKRWLQQPCAESAHLQTIHFHVDGVQAFGKIPIEQWMSLGVDSVAISGHKIGAVQGTGALFMRKGRKCVPPFLGGAQEKNRRPGTENLFGIISFGMACQDSVLQTDWWSKIKAMDDRRQMLFQAIAKSNGVVMNSCLKDTLPNTVNFSVGNGEDLLLMLDMNGICASSGSACSSGANLPSKTLLAMGRSAHQAKNAIRLSLSWQTSDKDIANVIGFLEKAIK